MKEQTQILIATARDLARGRRDQLIESGQAMMLSPGAFIREMCSPMIKLGRRAGHTSAIRELYRKGDQIIVHREAWKKEIAENHPRIPDNAVWVNEINRPLKHGSEQIINRHSTVWVDDYSFMTQHTKDRLFDGIIGEAFYVYGVEEEGYRNLPIVVLLG